MLFFPILLLIYVCIIIKTPNFVSNKREFIHNIQNIDFALSVTADHQQNVEKVNFWNVYTQISKPCMIT